ncbi:hypothetical protein [Longimicrobium sp.]|uniref:hypothetical protein n=1 Tax=Longimicrobium sp. TaxID=2029185 RepID=UPI002E32FE1B|nr:hypothetical protein [Longimicrobium sp.]HEX6042203.1 hypothetical protein [Longimicrobium sp.]
MNRMRILAVLTLLVVFVAGGLVGAAVAHGRGGDGPRDRPPRGNDRRGPPPMFAEGSPVAERLKLTPVQRDSIETLTTRDRARADSVFREMRQRMRSRFDSTMTAVDAVLTPEQRAEWQKIREEWQAREREGRGRRGGRGRPDRGPFPDGPPPPPPTDSAAR